MTVLPLAAKSLLAVILLIAGGAKLSDLPRFAGSLRMFLPWRSLFPALHICAAVVAFTELALGVMSLSWPDVRWLNLAVLALSCVFVIVSAAGYALFRGRSCQCFGSLSQRNFDISGILRSIALAAIAVIATAGVPANSEQLSDVAKGALFCSAGLVAAAAFVAARALEVGSSNLNRS